MPKGRRYPKASKTGSMAKTMVGKAVEYSPYGLGRKLERKTGIVRKTAKRVKEIVSGRGPTGPMAVTKNKAGITTKVRRPMPPRPKVKMTPTGAITRKEFKDLK